MLTTRIKSSSVIKNIALMRSQGATEALVRTMHIDIHGLEDGDLHQRINPRTIQQTADIEGNSPGVECQQICIFHQRPTALQELLFYRSRRLLMPSGEELLETGGATFLTLTVVGIVIIEHTREEIALG